MEGKMGMNLFTSNFGQIHPPKWGFTLLWQIFSYGKKKLSLELGLPTNDFGGKGCGWREGRGAGASVSSGKREGTGSYGVSNAWRY